MSFPPFSRVSSDLNILSYKYLAKIILSNPGWISAGMALGELNDLCEHMILTGW